MEVKRRHMLAMGLAILMAIAYYCSGQYEISRPGLLADVWDWSYVVFWLAGCGAGFLTGRWRVLVAALAPIPLGLYLHLIGYLAPGTDGESIDPLTAALLVAVVFSISLTIGVLLNRLRGRKHKQRRPVRLSPNSLSSPSGE